MSGPASPEGPDAPEDFDGEALLQRFDGEALYDRSGWFVHRLVGLDRDARQVVGELDTTRLGALVTAQREVGGHERHVPAAIVIQMTGTLGHLWAVLGRGLRASDGWHGYGTHIHKARFSRLGLVGPPAQMTATCTRERQLRGTWFLDFDFVLRQEGEVVYRSKQSAAWRQGA